MRVKGFSFRGNPVTITDMEMLDSLRPYYEEEEILLLEEALKKPSTHALYLNHHLISDEDFQALYPGLRAHPFIPHAYYFEQEDALGKSLLHNIGGFYILDAASMVSPYFLSPKKGERILDIAAAPGGKTSILSLMLEDGVLLSNDLSYKRALELSGNVERLGLSNVVVTSGDFEAAHPQYEEYFDAIMLDAPCSGSAMFRKDARLEQDWSKEKVLKNHEVQLRLLHLASTMLRPGGRILYSTCSFSYEEDEGSVLGFLKEHEDFEAVPLMDHPCFYHHKDLPEGIHLFPSHYEGEGQFLCLLRKKGEKEGTIFEKGRAFAGKLDPILKDFDLEGKDIRLHNDALYALPHPMRVSGLSLLRYGVKLGETSPRFLPDIALARALGKGHDIPLIKEKALAYLAGETFPLDGGDGFRVVSYLGIPLGFVKLTKGVAKNHYPKGLRRRY